MTTNEPKSLAWMGPSGNFPMKKRVPVFFHNNNHDYRNVLDYDGILITADVFNVDRILKDVSYQTISDIKHIQEFDKHKITILKLNTPLKDQLQILKKYDLDLKRHLEYNRLIIQLPFKDFVASQIEYLLTNKAVNDFNDYYRILGRYDFKGSYRLPNTDTNYLQILNETGRDVVHIKTTKDLATIHPQTDILLCELPEHQLEYIRKVYSEKTRDRDVLVYILPNKFTENVPSLVESLATELLVITSVVAYLIYLTIQTPALLQTVIRVVGFLILLAIVFGSFYITRNIPQDYKLIKERKLKGWTFMYTVMLLAQPLLLNVITEYLAIHSELSLGVLKHDIVLLFTYVCIVVLVNVFSWIEDVDGFVNNLSHTLAKKGIIK